MQGTSPLENYLVSISCLGKSALIKDTCGSAGSVKFNSLRTHELQPSRPLCPWDSPGKNSRVGCHFLLQGIFLIQECELKSFASLALAGRFFPRWAILQLSKSHSSSTDSCFSHRFLLNQPHTAEATNQSSDPGQAQSSSGLWCKYDFYKKTFKNKEQGYHLPLMEKWLAVSFLKTFY